MRHALGGNTMKSMRCGMLQVLALTCVSAAQVMLRDQKSKKKLSQASSMTAL